MFPRSICQKLQIFPTCHVFNTLQKGCPQNFVTLDGLKTRMMGLPGWEKVW